MNINTLEAQSFITTDDQIVARELALAAYGEIVEAGDPRSSELASDRYRKRLAILCRSLGTTDERAVGNAIARLYAEEDDDE